MDKAGALIDLLITALMVWLAQANTLSLSKLTIGEQILFYYHIKVIASAFGSKLIIIILKFKFDVLRCR